MVDFWDYTPVFAGLPVVAFDELRHRPDEPRFAAALADPASVAWRLGPPHDPGCAEHGPWCRCREEDFDEHLEAFFGRVDPARVRALIAGGFGLEVSESTAEYRDLFVDHADRLTGLRSLFFTEYTTGDSEISWIVQCDMVPLLDAYPGLTDLTVRGGGDELNLGVAEHPSLRSLTLQNGGMPGATARSVMGAGLPALEHLELWPGVEEYGGSVTVDDLAPLLDGRVLGGVRSLGLRNAERTDEWVRALAGSPVLERLEVLDLSLGTLTDEGARVLMETPGFRGLRRLDLHHNYMTEETAALVREVFTAAGTEVDVEERMEGAPWRVYPAVSE
ncbi:STM4015 family protein [Nocardiopsis sp. NPDC006139]|uniref:STM4015 family protein n=1 Tax=Nocardiopsis sp. NPDC006139 TaxID=3154578 RepID=UPI0033A0841D